MEDLKNLKDYETFIKARCKNSAPAAMRAMLMIYCLQTEYEKYNGITTGTNHVGFGKIDAELMTRNVISLTHYGRYVNKAEAKIIQNKVSKYWRQITQVWKGEIPEPAQYRQLIKVISEKQKTLD